MAKDFKTIANEISDGIKNGTYTETLPSIARLSKQFDVCPATVKRVLAQLRDWNLVSGEHGRCVRINPKAEDNEFFRKNIVILATLYSISMPYFENTLTNLTNLISKIYMTTHIFFTSDQIRECNFRPDCIIAVSNNSQVMLDSLLEKFPDCPVVRFVHVSCNYPVVTPDSWTHGYDGMRHLANDCGHKHIGIIATQLQYKNDCFNQRYEGALSYAAKHPDIKLSMVEVPELEMYSQASYRKTEELMKIDPEISAVFALNDMLALGVYSYAMQHKLTIPDDLAVLGCDNENFGKCLMPSLTTFDDNTMDVAKLLFQQILEALQGKRNKKVHYNTPFLVQRGSTRRLD